MEQSSLFSREQYYHFPVSTQNVIDMENGVIILKERFLDILDKFIFVSVQLHWEDLSSGYKCQRYGQIPYPQNILPSSKIKCVQPSSSSWLHCQFPIWYIQHQIIVLVINVFLYTNMFFRIKCYFFPERIACGALQTLWEKMQKLR
jgi:hypothetical protein